MSATINLSSTDRGRSLEIGDFVLLELSIEEKAGDWKISPDTEWISSGSFTLYTPSLKTISTEADTTRFSVKAMVHSPGPLQTEAITLRQGENEIIIGPTSLGAEVAPPAEAGSQEPPWTLPPVPFGGWNIPLLAGLGLGCLFILLLILRGIRRGVGHKAKKLSPRETALQALQALQSFAREKQALRQEEWKRFSYSLVGALRRYCDENFQINTIDLTDREFIEELRLQQKATAYADAMAGILTTLDEVRYGTKALDSTMVPSLLVEAKRFIELTSEAEQKEGLR